MSKKGRINKLNRDLMFSGVRVLQYSYVEMFSNWDNPCRTAPFWRFYWNRTPGAAIEYQGKCIEMGPEYVVIIPPHTNYASHSTGSFTQLYMHFEWDGGISIEGPLIFPATPVKKHLLSVEEWFEQEQAVTPMYAILLYYLAECQARLSGETETPHDPRVDRAVELINSDTTMSNGDVAARLNMSRDNFQRLFRKEMGMTPCRYRISRRMEQAQELLQNSSFSIEDIARKTGFCDRYQFSKSYKQFFKCPPGKVRRKQLELEEHSF